MEFKSQICTSKEQSEKLLALGLKMETADCIHFHTKEKGWEILILEKGDTAKYVEGFEIPAWSLHRLLFLIPKEVHINGFICFLRADVIMRLVDANFIYERLIGMIEKLIKQGFIDKNYLKDEIK